MLHLQARVHLQKVEPLAGGVRARDDQLDRAGAVIAHRACQRDGLLAHPLAHFGRDEGRWRFFHHLLMATLDRAFALAQINDIALGIAEDLDFDVARLLDELLDEHAVVAKAGEPFALGRLEAVFHVLIVPGEAHALAAAARAGLHHDRIADLVGPGQRVFCTVDRAFGTGHRVHARIARELLGFDLVTHRSDGIGGRANEGDAGVLAGQRKALALGQEAIARVDRIGAGVLGRLNDLVRQQIGLRSGRRAEMNRLVRQLDMRAARIGIRIDRDRGDAHLLGRTHDPASDLAAIGDQDFLEHQISSPCSKAGVLLVKGGTRFL